MQIDRRAFMSTGSLGLLAASLPSAAAGAQRDAVPDPVRSLLTDRFGQAGGSSGAVAIVRRGALAGFWSSGFASIPFRAPITQRTLFHVGSVGKHVTALLVLRLVDAGRVRLDARIGAYVRDLPASWARVSIRHLLQHLSGIPDYTETLTEWDRPQTRRIVIDSIGEEPAAFAPGARWAYSNTNYLLLGWLIEDVGGASYAAQVADQLFRPAGLPHARADAAQVPIAGRAEPYEVDNGVVRHSVRMENAVSAAADGGLLFSAADWGPWIAALEARRFVSAESWRAMHMPARLNSSAAEAYGFGWGVHQAGRETFYSHSGSVPGFETYVLRAPARELAVIVMLNLSREGPDFETLPAEIAVMLHPGADYSTE